MFACSLPTSNLQLSSWSSRSHLFGPLDRKISFNGTATSRTRRSIGCSFTCYVHWLQAFQSSSQYLFSAFYSLKWLRPRFASLIPRRIDLKQHSNDCPGAHKLFAVLRIKLNIFPFSCVVIIVSIPSKSFLFLGHSLCFAFHRDSSLRPDTV